MNQDSIRRALVFAVLFGAAMGGVVWIAGGLTPADRAPRDDDAGETAAVHPGEVSAVARNLAVGRSENGTLSHDAVKVIDGKPRHFRAWTAAWKTSTPRRSPDPETGIQDVVEPRVVLYPEPDTAAAAPLADGAPGTTRVTAKTGVLEYQKDIRTTARLAGDVLLERFDPQSGDLRLATPSLDCTMDSRGAAERRHAQTTDPVTIDGRRAHIAGTGLDADLDGTQCRVTLLSDVKGRFDAASGSLTGTGGAPSAKSLPTDVTCSGACELVSLDASKARPSDRRWKATFHEDVHVQQGEDTLDCDLLEIEFRMNDAKAGKGQLPPERVVATGHVRIRGRTETRNFGVTCDKATRTSTGIVGNETDVVVFEGSPVMDVRGPFSMAAKTVRPGATKPTDDGSRGRLEIRCDGLATMTTKKAGNQPSSPNRTTVVFERNVVAHQWDDERVSGPTGELRAAKATLFGTRLEDGPFQPDTLTAQDDRRDGPGVDLKRPDFTSHSAAATWARIGDTGIDRYLLVGTPKVVYRGISPLRGFGKPKAAKDAVLVLTSDDNVTIDLYDDRPATAGQPARPMAMFSAGPRVVLVQMDDGEEVSRLTAHQLDGTIARGRRLEQVRASGGAHVWGLDPAGTQRDVYATRILLDELVPAKDAAPDAPRSARIMALGEEAAPAVAIVREPDGTSDDVRAETLTYDGDGTVLSANGHVVATASVPARDEKKTDPSVPKLTDGAVRITANEARAELLPGDAAGASSRRLRRVTASGNVLIDGKLNRIVGREATYDAVTGIAEVTGDPARVVSLAESERYTSFLNSDLIRAYFDVASNDPAAKGRLLRASCPKGGLIVRYFDPPGPDGKPVAGAKPRRMQVQSDGPMESTRTEATAVGNVRADMWSLAPSGDWTIHDATLHCERAHLTFESDAPGAARERLRTLDCQGGNGRQVSLRTDDFNARADRVDVDCTKNTMRLSTSSENSVYVHQLSSGRQILYDGVTYDYVTHEWSDGDRMRESDERPLATPGGK